MKNKFVVPVMLSFLLVLFANAGSAFAGWHDWSQWQRNQAIINRAYQDLNQYVGLECKPWLQSDVVYDASGYEVWLPLTRNAPYDYLWEYSPDVISVSLPIQYASIGSIVQMRTRSGISHTAIVVGITTTTVTFIDSNFYPKSFPNTVKVHSMTFDYFYNTFLASPGSFSINYIL